MGKIELDFQDLIKNSGMELDPDFQLKLDLDFFVFFDRKSISKKRQLEKNCQD